MPPKHNPDGTPQTLSITAEREQRARAVAERIQREFAEDLARARARAHPHATPEDGGDPLVSYPVRAGCSGCPAPTRCIRGT